MEIRPFLVYQLACVLACVRLKGRAGGEDSETHHVDMKLIA